VHEVISGRTKSPDYLWQLRAVIQARPFGIKEEHINIHALGLKRSYLFGNPIPVAGQKHVGQH
jgi:hypothetical protein